MKLSKLALLCALAITLVACNQSDPTPVVPPGISPLSSPVGAVDQPANGALSLEAVRALAPAAAPQPTNGRGSISGIVYSERLGRGVGGTGLYLTKGVGKENRQISPLIVGPQREQGDIVFRTDAEGRFELNDIPPGPYFMVMMPPDGWVVVETTREGGIPQLVDVKADQGLPLGLLYVLWP
jgi:hypothetical protein